MESNEGLRIHQVEISGMEGIHLADTLDARLTAIRIEDPDGFGTVDHAATRHYGILFEDTDDTLLDDFAVRGPMGAGPKITHALRFVESVRLTVSNGYVSAAAVDFPVQMVGRRNSSPLNELSRTLVVNNPRGVELSATSHWSLNDVQVVRSAECEGGDYAFAHAGTAADMVSCTDCLWSGCDSEIPTLGQLMAFEGGAVVVVPEPIAFCFVSF